MNTPIGMPEPASGNVVEASRDQLWSQRWLRPIVLVPLSLALIATLVVATLWSQRDSPAHLGSVPERVETDVQVDKKGDFSFAGMYIDEPGKDVQIVSVTPLIASNVEFLGASTIWPRTTPYGMQPQGPGYPHEGAIALHPTAEVIPASETSYVELPGREKPRSIRVLAGFRLLSGDIGALNGVELTYTADGKTVRQVYDYAALLCHTKEHCSAPDGANYYWPARVIRDFGLVR